MKRMGMQMLPSSSVYAIDLGSTLIPKQRRPNCGRLDMRLALFVAIVVAISRSIASTTARALSFGTLMLTSAS